jgi:hypothetical protein
MTRSDMRAPASGPVRDRYQERLELGAFNSARATSAFRVRTITS